jgi:hypothetical protein
MTFLPFAWLFFRQNEAEFHRVVTEKLPAYPQI